MLVPIPDGLRPDAPDARVETPDASCSLWWSRTPRHEGLRVGCIGHFGASGDPRALLDEACEMLRANGSGIAVGPMDGSTWRKYRFVTMHGTEPPFLLEPWNPLAWPKLWEAAGFAPIMRYTSALQPDLTLVDPRVEAAERALLEAGYAFRPLALDDFEDELRRIHPMLLASFAENFLYTPLDEAAFLGLYMPTRPLLRADSVLLAEHEGAPAGLFFTYPTDARTLVLKTLAVHPRHAGKGIGGVLAARIMRAGRDAGFERAIHALMQETNRSQRISAHYGETMREYALFGRRL